MLTFSHSCRSGSTVAILIIIKGFTRANVTQCKTRQHDYIKAFTKANVTQCKTRQHEYRGYSI